MDRAEHARHTPITGRRVRVMRMAGETHLDRGRDRDDRSKKAVNTLPILLLRDNTGPARGCVLIGPAPAEGGITRATPTGFPLGARYPNHRKVVFGGGDARRCEPLDQTANAVDLALPLGVLAQQDVRAVLLLDRARRYRQLRHIEAEAEGADVIAMAAQVIEAPMVRIPRWIDADVCHSELRPDPVVRIISW